MIRKIERKWFEVWGNEVAQNEFLKGVLAFLIALTVVQSIVILILGLRGPKVIAVTPTQSVYLKVEPPSEELFNSEVVRVVKDYIQKHHNWDYQKIEKTQSEAAKLVGSGFQKAFLKANAEQVRIAREKKLSQRFYLASEPVADFKTKTVKVSGDRIIVVEGLRATNPLKLELSYEAGPHSETNPSGIYVTAEKLVTDTEQK